MQAIIDFFKYTIDGWVYGIYFVVMLIFSFACLGIVGEKISKRTHAELMAKREALARKESEKAKDIIKKQSEYQGVNNILDPTANKVQQSIPNQGNGQVVVNSSSVNANGNNSPEVEKVPAVLVVNEDGSSNTSS